MQKEGNSFDKLRISYKLSELPDNLMLSPKYLLDWWDKVIDLYGSDRALNDKSSDFKLARELWVAAVFACCKRLSSDVEHWVSAVSGEAPDAVVAYFEVDYIGASRQIYPIEVTVFDNNSDSIEKTIKKKLDKAYDPTTRIICYVVRTKDDYIMVDLKALMDFVSKNNPRNFEVWLLGGFISKNPDAKNPQKLSCLTTGEDYQIDMAEEKLVPNRGEAVFVPTQKYINKEGKLTPRGKIALEYPSAG